MCEIETYDFEKDFIDRIKEEIPNNLKISNDFRVAVRVSSSRASTHTAYRDPYYSRANEYVDYPAGEYTHIVPMDLKKSETFVLHYNEEARKKKAAVWYKKETIFNANFNNIPPRSYFFMKKPNRDEVHKNRNFPDNYHLKHEADFPKLDL